MKTGLIIPFMFLTLSVRAQLTLPLYEGQIPNSKPTPDKEKTSVRGTITVVDQISKPTISVYLPPENIATGAAVIIYPGGGYWVNAIVHEGTDVARKLNDMGVAAFVVKYRIPNDETMINREIGPLQDAQQAIRMVRQRAREWKIDPQRIGIMGFSAGGTIAASAGFQYTAANRPDFIAPIYAYMPDSFMSTVPADAPPMFLACTTEDDLGLTTHSLSLYNKWYAAKRPVEMHLYEKGYHGFGMGIKDTTTEGWIEQFEKWLALRGLMKPVNK